MKIVNRKTFLALQGQVLFAKFTPIVFGDLTIKVGNSSVGNDFVTQGLIEPDCSNSNDYYDALLGPVERGESFKLDLDCCGRDGLYDEDQLFAVYERADLDQLIARLQEVRESMPE